MEDLVFWQPILSIHQSALLTSLAACSGARVTLAVAEATSAIRNGLAWQERCLGETRIILDPLPSIESDLLSGDHTERVHIFSGTRGCGPMVWHAFSRAVSSGARVGVYSEAQNGAGVKGIVRLLVNKFDATRYRDRIDFILGTGSLGTNWFKKSGYRPETLFRFGYFVPKPPASNGSTPADGSLTGFFDLIFVGQLIHRKGWDVLLQALGELETANWRLHVVGDGVDRDKFRSLCEKLQLAGSVCFYGSLPNSQAISFMRKSDLLVLPSRFDGWGAVVNEALMCGTPVVCSDRCGAADLLDGSERGEVFPAGSVSALRSALARRISQGKKDAALGKRIREWSHCISGESAAQYLLQVIEAAIDGGSKPAPPWSSRP